ncbi:MAG: protein arginine kinase [Clostridiales bacterium]|jgi:protein arginine kinase|nr:protein arginine kinase [Clostridiales bacterium]
MSWINETGPQRDVVLSSRARIARNIANIPFPSIMKPEHGEQVAQMVRGSFSRPQSPEDPHFDFMHMRDVPVVERQILVERHLASQDLMENAEVSALLLDSKEKVTIMINEEDHIRMQCILPGLQLSQAWEIISKVDDMIEEQVEYAFHEKLGYLTCCPTNVGTGLRASVMMHLPALTMNKQMNVILQTISKIGLTARGIYGEGSEALGNIYQISNQITLGPTEEDIISNLTIACNQIVEKERIARKALYKTSGIQFDDAVWRSIGILQNARVLELKEFMALISQVRIGVSLGLIPGFTVEEIDALMTIGQPAGVIKKSDKALDANEIDVVRADVIREVLKEKIEKVETKES